MQRNIGEQAAAGPQRTAGSPVVVCSAHPAHSRDASASLCRQMIVSEATAFVQCCSAAVGKAASWAATKGSCHAVRHCCPSHGALRSNALCLTKLPSIQRMLLPFASAPDLTCCAAHSAPLQVCLAAEKCGHVNFDTLGDTWYSSEPFHCGAVEPQAVSYLDIYKKVGSTGGRRRSCLSVLAVIVPGARCA